MGLVDRVRGALASRRRGEQDAPAENAGPRAAPGREDPQERVTGTEPEQETFVGRAGAEDPDVSGPSGADRRSGREPGLGDGAARDA